MMLKRILIVVSLAALCMMTACSEERPFSSNGTQNLFFNLEEVEAITRDGTVHSLNLFQYRQPWTEDARLFYLAPYKTYLKFKGIPVYDDAVFHVGFGLSPDAPPPPKGELFFRVEMEAGGSRSLLLDKTVTTSSLEPGVMVEAEIPLPSIDVDKVDLLFYSEATLDPKQYIAVWCGPRVVSGGERVRQERSHVSYQRIDGLLLDLPPVEDAGEGRYYRSMLDGS
ncbi:MAG: hypothetical protein ABIK28_03820, partial [Planctomycetota bacterium]